MKKNLCLALVASALLVPLGASATAVTDQMLEKASSNTHEVLSNGLGSEGERFSPLKAINAQNVSKLVPAWTMSFGGEKQRGQE